MSHCQNSLTYTTNIIFFNTPTPRVHELLGVWALCCFARRARAERTCSRAPVRHRPLYSILQQRRHHGASARRRLLDLLATVVAHNARIAFAAPLPLPSTSSYRVCLFVQEGATLGQPQPTVEMLEALARHSAALPRCTGSKCTHAR